MGRSLGDISSVPCNCSESLFRRSVCFGKCAVDEAHLAQWDVVHPVNALQFSPVPQAGDGAPSVLVVSLHPLIGAAGSVALLGLTVPCLEPGI